MIHAMCAGLYAVSAVPPAIAKCDKAKRWSSAVRRAHGGRAGARDATIVIESGKIAAVGDGSSVRCRRSAGDRSRGEHRPGFIDTALPHRAQTLEGGRRSVPIDRPLDLSDPKWRIALSGGVTTVVRPGRVAETLLVVRPL